MTCALLFDLADPVGVWYENYWHLCHLEVWKVGFEAVAVAAVAAGTATAGRRTGELN